jgi:hypothetical protein
MGEKTYTREEVEKHNNAEDVWVISMLSLQITRPKLTELS